MWSSRNGVLSSSRSPVRGVLLRLVSFAISCLEFLQAGLGIDPAGASLQICERQRAEDLDAVFGEDRPGPLAEEQMVPDEENVSVEQTTDDEETASDGEADGDSPAASDARK